MKPIGNSKSSIINSMGGEMFKGVFVGSYSTPTTAKQRGGR